VTPPRLHIITGKGGVGKSTVAAALALALAAHGKTVLLCEVEGRQGISRLFGVGPIGSTEVTLADPMGSVYGLNIDPEDALREYLTTYFKLGPAARLLETFGVVEFATSIAPGLRDVLLTGKVYEATKTVRRGKGTRIYDAVVLDAPPTGRIGRFLLANGELAGLAKMGPIKSQADSVMATLRTRSAVHLVTLLEEMSVQETKEAVSELHAADLPVGSIILNQTRPQTLSREELAQVRAGQIEPAAIEQALAKVGVPAVAGLSAALVDGAREHAQRRELEDEQRAVLADLKVPLVELPQEPGGVDLAALTELAGLLGRGLVDA
jgi:anion-transporting  ArsA/GET3 family ATPase